MTFFECENCGGTIFSWEPSKHRCRPRFRIVCDEVSPDRAYFRHAASAEDAAMEWVEHQYDPDTNYYVVAGGGSRSIMVAVWQCLVKDGGFTDEYEGDPELYEVTGDFEPIYYAQRLNGDDSPGCPEMSIGVMVDKTGATEGPSETSNMPPCGWKAEKDD